MDRQIPMTVIETLIYCCITYWLTGLNSAGDRFIYFVLICGAYYFVRVPSLLATQGSFTSFGLLADRMRSMDQMTRAFNRFIACISPDLVAAQGISPVFTALSILLGGYIITRVRTTSPLV
jgi:hypothetical protein